MRALLPCRVSSSPAYSFLLIPWTYINPQLPRTSPNKSSQTKPRFDSIHSSSAHQPARLQQLTVTSEPNHKAKPEERKGGRLSSRPRHFCSVRRDGGGGGQIRGAARAATGGACGADAERAAPPLVARPVPHPDGAHRVAPRVQARPSPRGGRSGPDRRAGPGPGPRGVLSVGRAAVRVRRRRAAGGLQQRGRLVHRGRRPVPAGGRGLPRVPARHPQGRAAPAPAPQAQPRRREQAHLARPGDDVRVRRLRGGVPLQPRGGRRARRGAVHGRRGRAGARGGPHHGGAGVGPRRDPGPGRRAGRQPPGARRREAARVPRHRHLGRLHRPLQGPVRGGDRRRPVLGVRGAHRQGVAEPDPRRGLRPGLPRPPLLRHERAAAPPRPPPPRRRRVLRQLLLHHARLLHGREGGLLLHHRRGQDHQGGEEAVPLGVRAVGSGGDGRRRPVPDHLRLPDAARLRLDPPGLRRGGLRVGPARPRRPTDKPGLHRHVHPRQALGPQARRPPHHAVRHARPRRRLPRRHGGHELAGKLLVTTTTTPPLPFVHGFFTFLQR